VKTNKNLLFKFIFLQKQFFRREKTSVVIKKNIYLGTTLLKPIQHIFEDHCTETLKIELIEILTHMSKIAFE